jgi:capsular exopolysaccharide synthesis family protein
MLPNPDLGSVNIQDYIRIVTKRIFIVLGLLVVLPLGTWIYDSAQKPLYKSAAGIIIEQPEIKLGDFQQAYQPGYGKQDYYARQVRIISSYSLAEKSFANLNITDDPSFTLSRLRSSINVVYKDPYIWIGAQDTDPVRAAAVANMLARTYISEGAETKNRANKEAIKWFEAQLFETKEKLRQAEEAIGKYLQDNKIISEEEVASKESALNTLRAERDSLQAQLNAALKRYKEKFPLVISLREKLADINTSIEKESQRYRDLSQKMVQYNLLKKESESNQQLYNNLLGKTKDLDIANKIETASARLAEPAKPAGKPFKPEPKKDVTNAVFIALALGIGICYLLEYLDSTIKKADEVSIYLQLPFLGYIPKIEGGTSTERDICKACYFDPRSIVSESFRAVRTSILFSSPEDRPIKVIMITSGMPSEGKTFFSSNLAISFSHAHEKVVLIDCDMRKPRIHKVFGVEQRDGLSNFLIGNVPEEKIIKRDPEITSLSIITSGTIPPNPCELIQSGKMSSLLKDLSGKFDRVIVDAPPILSVSDSLLLANMVDGVIGVIKGASSRLPAAKMMKQKIEGVKGRVIGVVINNIRPEKEDSQYYYHYYYTDKAKKT